MSMLPRISAGCALAVLALAAPVDAKEIYVAQAAPSTGGANARAGTNSVAWLNDPGNWGAGPDQIGPGDTIHLVGTLTNAINLYGGGNVGVPTTLFFEPNANISMPAIPATGAIHCGNLSYLVIDGGSNGLIQSTSNGTGLGNEVASIGVCCGDGSRSLSGITVRNLTLTNLYARTAGSSEISPAGCGVWFYGNLTNVLVQNCSVSDCRTPYFFIYAPGSSSGVECCSNAAFHCNWGICVGQGNTGAHLEAVRIHHNHINLFADWEDPPDHNHHDGVFVFATLNGCSITNLVIRDNIIGPYFGLHVTAAVYVSCLPGGIQGLLIYNNVLFTSTNGSPSNGFIFVNGCHGCRIYNNTLDANNLGGIGIRVGTGANIFLANNIVSGMKYPLSTDEPSTLLGCDHNLYSYAGGAMQFCRAGGFWPFSQWKGWGYDAHSITLPAGFANPAAFDFGLQTNSLARGRGTDLSDWFGSDIRGNSRPRGSHWDIGAYAAATPPGSGH